MNRQITKELTDLMHSRFYLLEKLNIVWQLSVPLGSKMVFTLDKVCFADFITRVSISA